MNKWVNAQMLWKMFHLKRDFEGNHILEYRHWLY